MAVYTEVPDDALIAFVESYGLGEVTAFKGIAEGVENSNFYLATQTGQYILTLYEKRVARGDLPFFVGLVEHLAGRGVRCPVPVHDKAGQAIRELCGRPAAIFTFLDGMSVRRPQARHCEQVGRTLGALHLAGAGFGLERPNALGLGGWAPLFAQFEDQSDGIAPGLGDLISRELEFLHRAWPGDLPSGVIHADLFPDNIFFRRDEVSGVIDFYFACNDAFGYDIAICLNAWCFEQDHSFNITKGQALFRGYQAVRRLGDAERAAMPVLARGAALRFLLTRGYDWLNTSSDALVQPKDPLEYARRLRFHQSIDQASGFGLIQ
ncbi:MAG: homoserine kinase [Alphaproteobacteria bacterium]|nr:homoserine kinase [Alphaproteobacteria bacterium]